jgi:hypothetical protein
VARTGPGASQTGEKILATFGVPRRGGMSAVDHFDIPRDALEVGQNVHMFNGELHSRPGLVGNFAPVLPTTSHPNGMFASRYASSRKVALFVASSTQVFVLNTTNAWLSVLAAPSTGDRSFPTRFTDIAIGTPLVTSVIIANGVDTPRKYDLTTPLVAGASTVLTGAAKWRDVCTASDRIVGITATEVSWGEALRLDIWPELNVKGLTETQDYCVAIRPSGTLNVLIFKEHSIWIGRAVGGSSASYFRWQMLALVDGPAGPSAVTRDGEGRYYWMTNRGRIGMLDGSGPTWVADGNWPHVRDIISQSNFVQQQCHACYMPQFNEVWFTYGPGPLGTCI